MSDDGLEVDARARIDAATLRIGYRATNRSATPLFLFNILHREYDSGRFPLDRGGYVEIGHDAAVVSRKLFPVPPLTLVEKPNIPFVTRLAPGATFEEEFAVPLPLAPHDPYADPSGADATPAGQPRALFLELGYFVGADGTEAQARLFPTDAGERPGFSVFTAANQRLVRKGPLAMVPVAAAAR